MSELPSITSSSSASGLRIEGDGDIVKRIEQIILDERNLAGATMLALRAETAGLIGAPRSCARLR
jgi:hypothetical protein